MPWYSGSNTCPNHFPSTRTSEVTTLSLFALQPSHSTSQHRATSFFDIFHQHQDTFDHGSCVSRHARCCAQGTHHILLARHGPELTWQKPKAIPAVAESTPTKKAKRAIKKDPDPAPAPPNDSDDDLKRTEPFKATLTSKRDRMARSIQCTIPDGTIAVVSLLHATLLTLPF